MSTLEARVSALERRQTYSEARIEEVAKDMIVSFKQSSDDMTTSFGQVSKYLVEIEENNEKRFRTIETTLDNHSKRLGNIETTLDNHSKRLGNIETTLSEHTEIFGEYSKRLGNIETLLTQILARLPENR